jgi:hypothetical protein
MPTKQISPSLVLDHELNNLLNKALVVLIHMLLPFHVATKHKLIFSLKHHCKPQILWITYWGNSKPFPQFLNALFTLL